jgi:hypothetical protein
MMMCFLRLSVAYFILDDLKFAQFPALGQALSRVLHVLTRYDGDSLDVFVFRFCDIFLCTNKQILWTV